MVYRVKAYSTGDYCFTTYDLHTVSWHWRATKLVLRSLAGYGPGEALSGHAAGRALQNSRRNSTPARPPSLARPEQRRVRYYSANCTRGAAREVPAAHPRWTDVLLRGVMASLLARYRSSTILVQLSFYLLPRQVFISSH